jgi:hypothetical protein
MAESKSAKASEYLYHLKEYFKQRPDMRALIYARGSTSAQAYRRNLDTYEKVLRRKLKKLNIPIVGCYREVSSGVVLNYDRVVLVNAAKEAIIQKAVIVAPSTDRFLRNKDFNTKTNPYVLPTEAEFEELKKLTGNVPLVTLLHPDMSPRKVRGYVSKWGQKAKGNTGGHPILKRPGYKKKRREKELPKVRQLLKKGNNPTEIHRILDIPRSTISGWIETYI